MRWITPTTLVALTILTLTLGASSPLHSESPAIEVAWPQEAVVGDLVRIRGTGFHPKAAKNQVRFGGVEAQILEVLELEDGARELKVLVPTEAGGSGPVPLTVRAGGQRSEPLAFHLRPVVVAASVPPLDAGATVRLSLEVLGSRQPEPLEVVTLSPSTATLSGRVSRMVISGVVEADEGTKNVATVTVTAAPSTAGDEPRESAPPSIFSRPLPPAADLHCPEPLDWLDQGPQILEIVPATAGPGEPVRLRGRGFGEDLDGVTAALGDQPLSILDLRPGEILAQLPQDAASGPVRVECTDPETGDSTLSNEQFLPVKPRLLLSADRLDLLRGQVANVTATLVGTTEPTDLTAVITTPGVARMEGDAISGEIVTSGDSPNQVTFPVRGLREGRFELLATAFLKPDAPARARIAVPRISVPKTEEAPGGLAVPVEGVDQAGRPRSISPREVEWTSVPETVGTVDSEGRFHPGTDTGCGVLVGRWGDTAPVVVPVDVGGPGPVFQQAPDEDDGCEWRRICIDVFYLASPGRGGGLEVTAFEEFQDMLGTNFRPTTVPLQAGDFTQAGGALAPLKDKAKAADLVANLRSLLGKLSRIYEPCCIWFDLGEIYAVDPSKAQVSTDDTKLDAFINGDATHVSRRVRTRDGNLTFLDAAQRFVGTHSGLEANDCLKMFLAQELRGAGDEAGKAQNNGAYSVVGAGRIRPQDSGFVPAHEVGHNLMGDDHWERKDDQGDREFNVMEDSEPSVRHSTGEIFVDEETQCPKARERAEAIGTRQDPPDEDEGDEGEDGEDREPGDEPGPGGEEEPEEDGGQGEGPGAEESEEGCSCDEPRATTEGLDELEDLGIREESAATAVFTTCCGAVRLAVEVERKISEYDYTWELEFEKTREECFEAFELDRYYNSKRFRFNVRGGTVDFPVQVSEVELTDLGEGRFRLRGDGGFTRDYEGESDLLEEDNLDPNFDNSLNAEQDRKSWNLLLGGVVRCKGGEQIRSFPFHLIFRKEEDAKIQLEVASGVLPDEKAGRRQAQRDLVKETLARLPE